MEQKVRRIARWVERCALACRFKKWSEALMEIECARAELETVRSDLWERAEEEASEKGHVVAREWIFPFRVALVGGVILLCAALPLSTEDPSRSPYSVATNTAPLLEFVTPDERDLLHAMRSSLSNLAERNDATGGGDVSLRMEGRGLAVPGEERRSASGGGDGVTPKAGPVEERAGRKETTVSLEDVLALVQKGERALREVAVPVVGEDGETSEP